MQPFDAANAHRHTRTDVCSYPHMSMAHPAHPAIPLINRALTAPTTLRDNKNCNNSLFRCFSMYEFIFVAIVVASPTFIVLLVSATNSHSIQPTATPCRCSKKYKNLFHFFNFFVCFIGFFCFVLHFKKYIKTNGSIFLFSEPRNKRSCILLEFVQPFCSLSLMASAN